MQGANAMAAQSSLKTKLGSLEVSQVKAQTRAPMDIISKAVSRSDECSQLKLAVCLSPIFLNGIFLRCDIGNDSPGERGDPILQARSADAAPGERATRKRSFAQINRGSQKSTNRSRKVSSFLLQAFTGSLFRFI